MVTEPLRGCSGLLPECLDLWASALPTVSACNTNRLQIVQMQILIWKVQDSLSFHISNEPRLLGTPDF